mmetsp:Transcript_33358/g.72076  ORF Transcript_33358/g.72076 Transcript_33358/m.72076 type:complete len:140 (+) Transcript_33358:389-808(+)
MVHCNGGEYGLSQRRRGGQCRLQSGVIVWENLREEKVCTLKEVGKVEKRRGTLVVLLDVSSHKPRAALEPPANVLAIKPKRGTPPTPPMSLFRPGCLLVLETHKPRLEPSSDGGHYFWGQALLAQEGKPLFVVGVLQVQ